MASSIHSGEKVLVVLDSNHSKSHVFSELNAYCELVSKESYIVATDGIMGDLEGAPRSQKDWSWNNPAAAAIEFAQSRTDFVMEEPSFAFNEGAINERVTYWPNSYLRRVG